MCLGRKLKAKLAVLRSADRSIQYQTSDPIKIDENNIISLKLDSAVLRINNQGELTLDIPSQGDINSILNHLSNYLPSHSLTDSNIPLVTNGAGKAKWATDTIGSDVKPIFLNSGKITASNGNKGGSAKPIYMQGGELKESSSNLGGATTPIYMQNGELKEGTALNNGAYRDVALSIENSDKLIPSSLLYNHIIESNKDIENYTLINARGRDGTFNNSLDYGYGKARVYYKKLPDGNNKYVTKIIGCCTAGHVDGHADILFSDINISNLVSCPYWVVFSFRYEGISLSTFSTNFDSEWANGFTGSSSDPRYPYTTSQNTSINKLTNNLIYRVDGVSSGYVAEWFLILPLYP